MIKAAGVRLIVVISCVAQIGCGEVRVAQYEKIRYGMTQIELEAILGTPANLSQFDAAEFSLEKVKEYEWEYLAHISSLPETAEIKTFGERDKYIQVLLMRGKAVAKRRQGF